MARIRCLELSKVACLLLTAGFLFMSCGVRESIGSQPATSPGPTVAPAKSGWEQKWNDTLAGARQEGALMLYTSGEGPAMREQIFPLFRDRFGITIDLMAAKSDELTAKVQAERQRGLYNADAFIIGTQIVTSYKQKDILDPLAEHVILPDVTDTRVWPNNKLPYLDSDRYIVALTTAYWSYIMVNTELVKEGEIKSYRDLLNPKWKGQIVMFDPSGGGAAVNWVMFILEMAMGQQEGDKFLRQLAATQDLMVTRDARLQGEWVARGKYPIAIAPSMGAVTPLQKAGSPIAWVRVEEGGLLHPGGSNFGLANKRSHPYASTLLLNWLLTTEGQKLFSQGFGQPPARTGVPAEGVDPFMVPKPGEKLYLIDEKFIIDTETKGREIGKEIFGQLLK